MSDYNKHPYNTVEYYEEELKQKTLIAELVKEAVKARLANPENTTTIEGLSIAVLVTVDSAKYAEKQLNEARAKEKDSNDD
ncbi:MAG: hypothetical protein NC131_00905 [Roseburia sp.]|nr:hypothetical protein [Roseburia sp.]